MKDPLGAFDQVRENAMLYIQTAFGTQFPGLERERERMLRNTRPDFVVSNLMAGKAADAEANQEEVTAEVFEDTALRWALRRLAATPTGEEAVIVEEQVFRVLMRSLQATHSAARLAQKLAQFAQEYALPRHTYDRIQEEIRWITLTPKQKRQSPTRLPSPMRMAASPQCSTPEARSSPTS